MGPCTGHGSGGTRISSAYNIRWQVSIPSFKCVTFGHVIHKLVQHIPKEGGSEQEGDLSQVSLYKGLQYMLSCIDISLSTVLCTDRLAGTSRGCLRRSAKQRWECTPGVS